MLLVASIQQEIHEYRARHGGRSPALLKVPQAIMDMLDEEIRSLRLYRDASLPMDERKIAGVKIEVDPAMRIAFVIDETRTFSLPPRGR